MISGIGGVGGIGGISIGGKYAVGGMSGMGGVGGIGIGGIGGIGVAVVVAVVVVVVVVVDVVVTFIRSKATGHTTSTDPSRSHTLRASAVGLSRPTEGGSRRRGGAEPLLLSRGCPLSKPP